MPDTDIPAEEEEKEAVQSHAQVPAVVTEYNAEVNSVLVLPTHGQEEKVPDMTPGMDDMISAKDAAQSHSQVPAVKTQVQDAQLAQVAHDIAVEAQVEDGLLAQVALRAQASHATANSMKEQSTGESLEAVLNRLAGEFESIAAAVEEQRQALAEEQTQPVVPAVAEQTQPPVPAIEEQTQPPVPIIEAQMQPQVTSNDEEEQMQVPLRAQMDAVMDSSMASFERKFGEQMADRGITHELAQAMLMDMEESYLRDTETDERKSNQVSVLISLFPT